MTNETLTPLIRSIELLTIRRNRLLDSFSAARILQEVRAGNICNKLLSMAHLETVVNATRAPQYDVLVLRPVDREDHIDAQAAALRGATLFVHPSIKPDSFMDAARVVAAHIRAPARVVVWNEDHGRIVPIPGLWAIPETWNSPLNAPGRAYSERSDLPATFWGKTPQL